MDWVEGTEGREEESTMDGTDGDNALLHFELQRESLQRAKTFGNSSTEGIAFLFPCVPCIPWLEVFFGATQSRCDMRARAA